MYKIFLYREERGQLQIKDSCEKTEWKQSLTCQKVLFIYLILQCNIIVLTVKIFLNIECGFDFLFFI